MNARPKVCPVCGTPTDKILVCERCWTEVPRFDQIGFRRQFEGNERNVARWKFKAEKIVRNLRAKHPAPTSGILLVV